MNVRDWLTKATRRLDAANTFGCLGDLPAVDTSPRLDAELVLAHALARSRTWLYTWPEAEVAPAELTLADSLLERRAAGEPLAYLTGYREFWSLNLEVTPDVLVPRADTELLVEQALAVVRNHLTRTSSRCEHANADTDGIRNVLHSNSRADERDEFGEQACIIELGTGSGAIAIALATECHLPVIATDRSDAALRVARRNATRLAPGKIAFVQCDWLDAVADDSASLIISNPPYIAADDPHLQDAALAYEPVTSLVAAEHGLADIRQIVRQCGRVARNGCVVLLEHGHEQGARVRQIMHEAGLSAVATLADLSGRDRITRGVC